MRDKLNKHSARAAQRGLSIIELLIAIPLGLLVIFTVLQIFTANIQGVNMQNAFSRVQENGRMSLELISRDIRLADYWGCINSTTLITNNLDTSDPDYDSSLNPIGQPGVSGGNNVSSQTISSITVKDGTDTLTLRGGKGFSSLKLEAPMNNNSANIKVSFPNNIAQGDILLIGNCLSADLFTSTAPQTHANGTLVHNTGTVNVPGAVNNATKNFSQTYTNGVQFLVPYIKTYFIGENSAGGYSLYRSLDGTVSELVRGVNDLQLMYGEDTTANGSADTYADASAVIDMDNVLTIRVELVSESGNGVSGTPLQRNYTITTSIRNRTL